VRPIACSWTFCFQQYLFLFVADGFDATFRNDSSNTFQGPALNLGFCPLPDSCNNNDGNLSPNMGPAFDRGTRDAASRVCCPVVDFVYAGVVLALAKREEIG
jgi:hypothetical protein